MDNFESIIGLFLENFEGLYEGDGELYQFKKI